MLGINLKRNGNHTRTNGNGHDHLVDLRHVVKTFESAAGKFTALKGIDLQVSADEFVTIVGKSCCGKSTLINMITGIDRPTSGDVIVGGTAVNRLLEYEDQPVIWRGPLIVRAITQLWGDVFWDKLDYLLVDLPPGTADASLTTMQSLPVNGIVIVTTPQSLALMIVRKAVHMAQMVNVPIVGVVENMAYFVCPDTGKRHEIFGPSHSHEVSLTAGAPLLAQLPIDPTVVALCDTGQVEAVELPGVPEMVKAFVQTVPVTRPG